MKNNQISLVITTKCNFKCKHCLKEYYDKQYEPSFNLLKKTLTQAKDFGFNRIGITGGEPILHSRFNDFIKWIVGKDFSWGFTSNGWMYKQYDKAIDISGKKLKLLRLSFDGATEHTHDYIRQKGSFKKLLEATKHYKEKKLKILYSYVLNSKNIEEVPKIIELAEKMGVDGITFGSVIPNGYNMDLQVPYKTRFAVQKYIKKVNPLIKMKLSITNSLFAVTNADEFCMNINYHKPTINAYGDYIFCCDMVGQGAVIGSLKKESFKDLFNKAQAKADWLKEERRKMILNKQFFEGFNSCHFCNLMLEDITKKHKGYAEKNKLIKIPNIEK